MRCPSCRARAEIILIRYTELGPENELVELNRARLSCGCEIPLADLPQSTAEWDQQSRRRADEIFRRIFS